MQRDLDWLTRETFDLLVIGGGISGACMAHDAALRGLSVALIDERDFGAATSAASSKLLHGGIRYLQQGRLDKVRESALERAAFQAIAPHLTRYVPFLIPTYPGWTRGRTALTIGVALYQLICRGQNRLIPDPSKHVPASARQSRSELLGRVPALSTDERLTGAHVLYESHMYSPERVTLAFVKTAAAGGAAVANYVAAEAFVREGGTVRGVVARDILTGRELRIAARVTANAAGPWLSSLNEQLGAGRLGRAITGFSKGAHIVTRQIVRDFALVLPTSRKANALVTRGGRHVFVIPWRGRSLIGTSDSPFDGQPQNAVPTEQDVADLLGDVNATLPGAGLRQEDVLHAFAGLYPLTDAVLRHDVYQGTGSYQIVDHAVRDSVDGCMSVLGAKFTTARRLAERATDLALKKLRRTPVPCRTQSTPLVGGEISDMATFAAEVRRRHPGLDADVAAHLTSSHGSEVNAVLEAGAGTATALDRLSPDRESIEAEVLYAVDQEMAVRLDDVIFRRTGLGTVGHPGPDCLRRCAGIMRARLGWGAEQTDEETRRTERQFGFGRRRTE